MAHLAGRPLLCVEEHEAGMVWYGMYACVNAAVTPKKCAIACIRLDTGNVGDEHTWRACEG